MVLESIQKVKSFRHLMDTDMQLETQIAVISISWSIVNNSVSGSLPSVASAHGAQQQVDLSDLVLWLKRSKLAETNLGQHLFNVMGQPLTAAKLQMFFQQWLSKAGYTNIRENIFIP